MYHYWTVRCKDSDKAIALKHLTTNSVVRYYLPPYRDCSKEFILQQIKGEKGVSFDEITDESQRIRLLSITRGDIPRLDEFNIRDLYKQAIQIPALAYYLPTEKRKRPINRDFFFDVSFATEGGEEEGAEKAKPQNSDQLQILATKCPDFLNQAVEEALQQRIIHSTKKPAAFTIAPDVFEEMQGNQFHTALKRRELAPRFEAELRAEEARRAALTEEELEREKKNGQRKPRKRWEPV